jgi:hypothetical protein
MFRLSHCQERIRAAVAGFTVPPERAEDYGSNRGFFGVDRHGPPSDCAAYHRGYRAEGGVGRYHEDVRRRPYPTGPKNIFDQSTARGSLAVKRIPEPPHDRPALIACDPNARILYVSATGATTVHNLAHAQRLGFVFGLGVMEARGRRWSAAVTPNIVVHSVVPGQLCHI